ncbi:MAG: hypothetical protein DHS20C14_09320 [Phycisphaeraceae bacterium]|nr:MAG: hypothetical protein DHS20C14_09320 [Phycisphaeraceae bacterium]
MEAPTNEQGRPAGAPGDEMIAKARAGRSKSPEALAAARAFAVDCAMSMRDDKCEDIVVLDVSDVSQVTDFIVVGTGTSDRQMRGAIDSVSQHGKTQGFRALGSQADERGTWLLADFVDVMVHVFEPNTRAHYDIEMLWGDTKRVEVPDGPGPLASKRAGGASA